MTSTSAAGTSLLSIQGTAAMGETLTAVYAGESTMPQGYFLSYQWLLDGEPTSQRGPTFDLTNLHVGREISVEAKLFLGFDERASFASNPTGPVEARDPEIRIVGEGLAGNTLQLESNIDLSLYTVEWLRDGVPIEPDGLVSSWTKMTSYKLTEEDAGAQISVKATLLSLGGNETLEASLPGPVGDMGTVVKLMGGFDMPEGFGEIQVFVLREGDTSSEITLSYEVTAADGEISIDKEDLVRGVDFSGSLTIPAGEAGGAIKIAIKDDAIPELNESLKVIISPGAGWPENARILQNETVVEIRDDDNPTPITTGGPGGFSYGDPHLVSFDGLSYSFQAVGEFTLAEARRGAPLEVQVRYRPAENSDLVSWTKAVATQAGTARISVDLESEHLLKINGKPIDLTQPRITADTAEIFYNGDTLTIVYGNGEQLWVHLQEGYLNLELKLDPGRDIHGLLGNADGSAGNDLALRDGTILTAPLDFAGFYGIYAESWRVTAQNSLFDYPRGKGTADYQDRSFPVGHLDLSSFPAAMVQEALQLLAQNGITDPVILNNAALDYMISGDLSGVLNAATLATRPTQAVTPAALPPLISTVGVFALEAYLPEGDSGTSSAQFAVYRGGDLSQPLSGYLTLTGAFGPNDVAGNLAKSVTFQPNQEFVIVGFDVIGDSLFEEDDELTATLTVISGNASVINRTASMTVQNDDYKPFGLILSGDVFPNLLPGLGGDDHLLGAAGDDTLAGDLGDDTLEGGAGEDTGFFAGLQSAYTLHLSPTSVSLTDRSPDGQGTDTLVDIEILDFGTETGIFVGGTMKLSIFDGPTTLTAPQFSEIIELYIAYFNRAPDALGLFYWATEYANGFTVPDMAANFFYQPETQATYTSVLDASGNLDTSDPGKVGAFVTEVYANVLGRSPDTPGFDYWVNELTSNPAITPDVFILAIIGGAKFPSNPTSQTAIDQAYLATKSDLGAYFAVIKGMSDISDATAAMALYDGSTAGRDAALIAMDGHYADALDPTTGDFLMPLVGVIDDPFL
jgi:hypothetical protein